MDRNDVTTPIGVVVLVLKEKDMILFSKRTNAEDHLKGWIPLAAGGHIEVGETAEEAIVREAKEELGVDVEITRFLGKIKHKDHLLVFECKLLKGEPKPDHREIEELRWFSIDEAKKISNNILIKKILDLL